MFDKRKKRLRLTETRPPGKRASTGKRENPSEQAELTEQPLPAADPMMARVPTAHSVVHGSPCDPCATIARGTPRFRTGKIHWDLEGVISAVVERYG